MAPQASPVFPKPVYSRAVVSNEPGVGSLLVSQTSARQFFCPAKDSRFIQTQFGGAVQTVFEATPFDPKEQDHDERTVVIFAGRLLRYCPSCPLALKTNRISVLKLEAQWQRCAMGELVGEVSRAPPGTHTHNVTMMDIFGGLHTHTGIYTNTQHTLGKNPANDQPNGRGYIGGVLLCVVCVLLPSVFGKPPLVDNLFPIRDPPREAYPCSTRESVLFLARCQPVAIELCWAGQVYFSRKTDASSLTPWSTHTICTPGFKFGSCKNSVQQYSNTQTKEQRK